MTMTMPAFTPVEAVKEEGCWTVGASLTRWAQEAPDEVAHTFIDYLADRNGVRRCYTWAQLDRWTRATAAVLAQMAAPGERVAIMAPSGPEYVAGFLAALRAGTVAIPLFSPELLGQADRLAAVLADCTPQAILAPADRHGLVVDFLVDRNLPVPAILCPDDLDGEASTSLADSFHDIPVDPDDLAYLQYTSGSTRNPAGVQLTHRNIVTNARQIAAGHALEPGVRTGVSWLPLFHDMGLLLGAAGSAVLRVPVVLMDPLAFVMDPTRWLRAIAEVPSAFTAAPNFAYDLAVRRVRLEEGEQLDLSRAVSLVNGAEPVLPGTIRRFMDAFGRYGLRPEAMAPSYGLAEATLMISTCGVGRSPTVLRADTATLQAGRLVPTGSRTGVTELVSSGTPIGQRVVIVDPAARRVLPDGEVGEIWAHGPNIGVGYHGQAEESLVTFGGHLVAPPAGLPEGPWLRTGDLGALVGGELFVTGRIKDLIIVDGRNIYPQDVEAAVSGADPALALNRVAVFSVTADDGHREAVVAVVEKYHGAGEIGDRLPEIEHAVRLAVSRAQGVALAEVVLVQPDSIPRTSSGKIARGATRTAYLEGTLQPVAGRPR